MIVELLRGVPNQVGAGTVYVMRVAHDSVRLGIEDSSGSQPSATYRVGDVLAVDDLEWTLLEVVSPGGVSLESAPGARSGEVVARIERLGTVVQP